MNPDQLRALDTLPFNELAALWDLSGHARDAYQFGALESCKRLIALMQVITGPWNPELLLIVRTQIQIVWVERTPALHQKRIDDYEKANPKVCPLFG